MRRNTGRSRALLAALLAMALALGTVLSAALGHAATALIMGGNSHALSIPQDTPTYIETYVGGANSNYIAPSGLCGPPCALVAVYTPEQIRFVSGLFDMTFDDSVAVGRANLDLCIRGASCTVTNAPYTTTVSQELSDDEYVVFGYSQSATIASQQKLQLIAHPVDATVSFILQANPNRPNGGILQRFVGAYLPFLGVTFNGATPTFSPFPKPLLTVDIARQYDGWSDFPTNPLNLLAVTNALLGSLFVHPDYFDVGTPQLQGLYQDTSYYLIPTRIVPLLTPLTWIPLVGPTLAVALDAPLRVLIETGYDRTINPGQPTPARYLHIPDLIRAAIDFAIAVPTGWDDAISRLTGNPDLRPFHTQPASSPYGVGGPPVYAGAVDPYGDPVFDVAPPTDLPEATVEEEHEEVRQADVTSVPADAPAASVQNDDPEAALDDLPEIGLMGDEADTATETETATETDTATEADTGPDAPDPVSDDASPDADRETTADSPSEPGSAAAERE